MRFPKSRLYESAFTPILLGLVVGFIASMMGIGGAFLMVPAMIYIVGMPVKLIPGTSLFVTIFISAIVTILHSFNYGSIDLFLSCSFNFRFNCWSSTRSKNWSIY